MVNGVADIEGMSGEGDKVGERGGDGSALGGGQGRGATHRTGGVEAEPGVDAGSMEDVAAVGKKAKDLAVFVIGKTDRARRVLRRWQGLLLAVYKLGVALQRGFVQTPD